MHEGPPADPHQNSLRFAGANFAFQQRNLINYARGGRTILVEAADAHHVIYRLLQAVGVSSFGKDLSLW
jgi:hypothetical protein